MGVCFKSHDQRQKGTVGRTAAQRIARSLLSVALVAGLLPNLANAVPDQASIDTFPAERAVSAPSAEAAASTSPAEFTVSAFDASYTLTYSYDAGAKTATVTGFSTDAAQAVDVTIPSTVDYEGDAYTVTAMADPAYDTYYSAVFGAADNKVRTLTLPDTMETVGAYEFAGMTALESLDLGGTKTIGGCAFYNCSLPALNVPASVTTLA